jgi:hypothetical protein
MRCRAIILIECGIVCHNLDFVRILCQCLDCVWNCAVVRTLHVECYAIFWTVTCHRLGCVWNGTVAPSSGPCAEWYVFVWTASGMLCHHMDCDWNDVPSPGLCVDLEWKSDLCVECCAIVWTMCMPSSFVIASYPVKYVHIYWSADVGIVFYYINISMQYRGTAPAFELMGSRWI